MLNRSKLWATVLLITVFAAGATVGGAAFSTWGPRDGAGDRMERGDDRGRRPSYAERLETDLGLTSEQREMVDTILAQQQLDMQELWRQMRPQFDALRDTIRSKIMDVLTDEQKQTYNELVERSRRRGERDRENQHNR
jgi:Spy/CpxP family protein refolding chaperone